jgi:hypothetical protein
MGHRLSFACLMIVVFHRFLVKQWVSVVESRCVVYLFFYFYFVAVFLFIVVLWQLIAVDV